MTATNTIKLTASSLQDTLARKFVDGEDIIRVRIGDAIYELSEMWETKTGSLTLTPHKRGPAEIEND